MGTRKRKVLKSIRALYRNINSKCSEDVIDSIVENLYIGLPIVHCCHLAGISEDTYFRWLDEGRMYLEAGEDDEVLPAWELSAEFFLAVKQAVARWQKKKLTQSLDCERFNMNWTRDLTLLERRDRANWGSNSNSSSGNSKEGLPGDDKFL